MGNVLGKVYGFANRIGLNADLKEDARKDREWLQNPQLRKLVPVPKCPNCKCRLDGLESDLSDSETDIKCEKEMKSGGTSVEVTSVNDEDLLDDHEIKRQSNCDFELRDEEKVLNSNIHPEAHFAETTPFFVK